MIMTSKKLTRLFAPLFCSFMTVMLALLPDSGMPNIRANRSNTTEPTAIPQSTNAVSITQLIVSDAAANDHFGAWVALSSNNTMALIGASNKTVGSNKDQGVVYAFAFDGTTWIQRQELIASDGEFGDGFGSAIALSASGTTALIGTPDYLDPGRAYIFTFDGTSWSQQQELIPSDWAFDNHFGSSVALSADGKIALIGAFGKFVGGNATQGAAYIFAYNGTTWSQQAELLASDGAALNGFGVSLALSNDGRVALIGAYGKTIRGREKQGAVYIFNSNGKKWSQKQEIVASDGAVNDNFGVSIGLSGGGVRALIGASGKAVGRNHNQGEVYVFTFNGTAWGQQQKLIASDGAVGDTFGYAVALSKDGATALIGAENKNLGSNIGQGQGYKFTDNTNLFQQTGSLSATSGAASDAFGSSVALSSDGRMALIGAYNKSVDKNQSQGIVYVFAFR